MDSRFHNRHFVLLEFNTSPHATMVVRSPGTDFFTGIDLRFWGVEYLDLPTFLSRLEVGTVENSDLEFIHSRLDRPLGERRIYVLIAENRRFRIVAERMEIVETDLATTVSPFRRRSPRPMHLGAMGVATVRWLVPEEGGFPVPPRGNSFTALARFPGQPSPPEYPALVLALDFYERPGEDRTHRVRVSFSGSMGPDDFFRKGQKFELIADVGVVAKGTIIRRIPPRRHLLR